MDFELGVLYDSYTREELISIVTHGGHTAEAVRVASGILERKYPDWAAQVRQHKISLPEEGHLPDVADLLADLEPPVTMDRFSILVFYLAIAYFVLWISNMALFIVSTLWFPGYIFNDIDAMKKVPFAGIICVFLCAALLLWIQKSRWGWNFVYAALLYQLVVYLPSAVKYNDVFSLPGKFYPGFPIIIVMFVMIFVIILILLGAARKRFVTMFRVVEANWSFTVILGWLLAIAYMAVVEYS